ncbi:unnamed protein product [Owenia fusiformis]|uniref:Uncharacterized protein n=1 Tax=Owenia fusiformis TaxID=6347 RepID=A0A8S4NMV1_OWEFU|nr:unnamed protein product [Owenia fusiformis]
MASNVGERNNKRAHSSDSDTSDCEIQYGASKPKKLKTPKGKTSPFTLDTLYTMLNQVLDSMSKQDDNIRAIATEVVTNSEMAIRNEVSRTVNKASSELNARIDAIEQRSQSLSTPVSNLDPVELAVFNLPESANESVSTSVNDLLTKGLGFKANEINIGPARRVGAVRVGAIRPRENPKINNITNYLRPDSSTSRNHLSTSANEDTSRPNIPNHRSGEEPKSNPSPRVSESSNATLNQKSKSTPSQRAKARKQNNAVRQ